MREMTEVELNGELDKMKKELFNLRFQHVIFQMVSVKRMKHMGKSQMNMDKWGQNSLFPSLFLPVG